MCLSVTRFSRYQELACELDQLLSSIISFSLVCFLGVPVSVSLFLDSIDVFDDLLPNTRTIATLAGDEIIVPKRCQLRVTLRKQMTRVNCA